MARTREPGWYSDPDAPGRWRWWDGQAWTEHAVSRYPKRVGGPAAGGADLSAAGAAGHDPGGDLHVAPEEGGARTADLTAGDTTVSDATFSDATYVDVTYGEVTRGGATRGDLTRSDLARGDVTGVDPTPGGLPSGGANPGVGTHAEFTHVDVAPGGFAPGGATLGGATNGGVAPGGAAHGGVIVDAGAATARLTGPDGPPGGRPGPSPRPRSRPERSNWVFLKRWAALVTVVVVVVVVLAIALRSHPPTLYWQGEPLTNGQEVLSQAEAAMQAAATASEGAVAAEGRCYFSLPNRSTHDVAGRLRCGPVLLPWSSPSKAWFTYNLSGRLTSAGEKLAVRVRPAPTATVGLAFGEALRRPDGTAPPKGDAGLAVPAVPRQPLGWGGVLSSPLPDLPSAPVADLIGDWGQSYRLVAYGEVDRLSAHLDEDALSVAINPPGSAWSTSTGPRGSGGTSRPRATLLLAPKGQVFIVAELALSAGEAAGPVPAQANGKGSATTDQPTVEVLGGTTAATFQTSGPTSSGAATLTVAASVPIGTKPVLEITDKGLSQQVSLADGHLGRGPSILSRAGTNEVLSVTGSLDGATIHVSDASLVWFAGSDGGTVPPEPNEAYLQILASASPVQDSFLPASDFTLHLPGGAVVAAQALPDSDREAIVIGFLVPASFSDGTVVVSAGGRSFNVPVQFA